MDITINQRFKFILDELNNKLNTDLTLDKIHRIVFFIIESVSLLTEEISEIGLNLQSEYASILLITCVKDKKFMLLLKEYNIELYQIFIDHNIKKRKEKISNILNIIDIKSLS
jgi:hypothetical protein